MSELLIEKVDIKTTDTTNCVNEGNPWCLEFCSCERVPRGVVPEGAEAFPDKESHVVALQYFDLPNTAKEDADHAANKHKWCTNSGKFDCSYRGSKKPENFLDCLECNAYLQSPLV